MLQNVLFGWSVCDHNIHLPPKNVEGKHEKDEAVCLTLADVQLWSECWNFSSVGTGISSEPETDGLTSGRRAETKSGEEENTTAERRALEGKLRITSVSTWAEVDGFKSCPGTHKEDTRAPQVSQMHTHSYRNAEIQTINELTLTQNYPFTHSQLCVSVCLHAELRHFWHSLLCPAATSAQSSICFSLPPTSLCPPSLSHEISTLSYHRTKKVWTKTSLKTVLWKGLRLPNSAGGSDDTWSMSSAFF